MKDPAALRNEYFVKFDLSPDDGHLRPVMIDEFLRGA